MGYVLLLIVLVLLVLLRWSSNGKRVAVLVIGDLGRSPRMQYHSLSLAAAGYHVDLIGYRGATLPLSLQRHPSIHVHLLEPAGFQLPKALFLIYLIVKVGVQLLQLFQTLLRIPRPSYLIVQNPPSIPTLFVAHVMCLLRGTRLLIDWHNFGYSILALSLGSKHPLVRVSYWYERVLGRGAHASLCVTRAMQQELAVTWSVKATVLYDRPPEQFRELHVTEKHELFERLFASEPAFKELVTWHCPGDSTAKSPFTHSQNGTVVARTNRPALIVSSTSWTEDEDFSILLSAIVALEQKLAQQGGTDNTDNPTTIPNMVFIITGKGPMKEFYENKIKELSLHHTRVLTLWLAAEDYPKLLGCADVGVSLHTSSSGLDLPMKVVDMFGCALPVCAINFPALSELVRDGENGLVFTSSDFLTNHLVTLTKGFQSQKGNVLLKQMRQHLSVEYGSDKRWHGNYVTHAIPLLD